MKHFVINLDQAETKDIRDLLTFDLDELCLEDGIANALKAILDGENGNGFEFTLDSDPTALVIMQTMYVYAERIGYDTVFDTRAVSLIRFATQMFPEFTGKTERDF